MITKNVYSVWLVGAGDMALEYLKVLRALECQTTVIGRSKGSADRFEMQSDHPVVCGGLDTFLESEPILPNAAIVAVGVEALANTTMQLLKAGVRHILLEKPGALTGDEIKALQTEAQANSAEVVIAYNRRFFASTLLAQRLIQEDGGIQSMNFEFTEWGHVIDGLKKADGVKDAWLLANSSHVIDLAFYLGGRPVELHAVTQGNLSWHPRSAIFAGSGRTDRDVLFSYQANWDAPGRWGVEVLTRHRRFIFRPMEMLQVMKRGSVAVDFAEVDDLDEKNFKPGLYKQVETFLKDGRNQRLCSLNEQLLMWPIYEKIAGYE